MVEPEAISVADADGAGTGTHADVALRSSMGFDRDDEGWLSLVRQCTAAGPGPLGRLGKYELLEEIGRGAQGTVYRAVQPGTNRQIALKRLAHGALAGTAARARFEREVEAAAALSHPGIVSVFGTDEIEGHAVLLMELVEGAPIDRWASEHGSGAGGPMREALGAFVQVCDAVAHAHQRGVLHRDLKPSNILVDRQGRVRVLDFGLAKVLDAGVDGEGGAAGHSRGSLSVEGAFMGTPAYAAPEQVAGLREQVDTRSDVYALGVVLYKLLTGVLPFGDEAPLAALFDQIRAGEFRRPSQAAGADGRSVNAELDAIVLKAMALEPGRRYQSVDALGADVRRYLAGETVVAHPPSASYQVRKWVRRHTAVFVSVATAAVVVTALAAVSSVLAWKLGHERDELRKSVVSEQEARVAAQEAQRAEAAQRIVADKRAAEAQAATELAKQETARFRTLNTFLNRMLARSGGETLRDKQPTLEAVLDEAARDLDAGALKTQPNVELNLRRTITSAYMELGLWAPAEKNSRRALHLSIAATGRYTVEAASLLNQLGMIASWRNKLAEAESLYRQALEVRDKVYQGDLWYSNGILANLGALLSYMGRLDEAAAMQQQVLEMRIAKLGPRDPLVGTALKNIGVVEMAQGEWGAAERHFREALEIFSALETPASQQKGAAAKRYLALALARLGRPEEAAALQREALQAREPVLPADHMDIGLALDQIAQVQVQMNLDEGAEASLSRALEIYRLRLDPGDSTLGLAMVLLGEIKTRRGRAPEGEALIREGMGVLARAEGVPRWRLELARGSLGESLAAQGRTGEALQEVMGAYLRVCEEDGNAEHPAPKNALLGRLVELMGR